MRHDVKTMSLALYRAVRDLDEKTARRAIRRFVETTAKRYGRERLNKVVEDLPHAAARAEGIEEVTVEVARELPRSVTEAAVAALGVNPAKAAVTVRVKPELLAGIRIRRPDMVFDSSAKRKLELFRRAAGSDSEQNG